MIYAYYDGGSKIVKHKSLADTGAFAIEISADGTVREQSEDNSDNFYLVHGWLMWTAWGVLGLF